jgi:hypothetical protein
LALQHNLFKLQSGTYFLVQIKQIEITKSFTYFENIFVLHSKQE